MEGVWSADGLFLLVYRIGRRICSRERAARRGKSGRAVRERASERDALNFCPAHQSKSIGLTYELTNYLLYVQIHFVRLK